MLLAYQFLFLSDTWRLSLFLASINSSLELHATHLSLSFKKLSLKVIWLNAEVGLPLRRKLACSSTLGNSHHNRMSLTTKSLCLTLACFWYFREEHVTSVQPTFVPRAASPCYFRPQSRLSLLLSSPEQPVPVSRRDLGTKKKSESARYLDFHYQHWFPSQKNSFVNFYLKKTLDKNAYRTFKLCVLLKDNLNVMKWWTHVNIKLVFNFIEVLSCCASLVGFNQW